MDGLTDDFVVLLVEGADFLGQFVELARLGLGLDEVGSVDFVQIHLLVALDNHLRRQLSLLFFVSLRAFWLPFIQNFFFVGFMLHGWVLPGVCLLGSFLLGVLLALFFCPLLCEGVAEMRLPVRYELYRFSYGADEYLVFAGSLNQHEMAPHCDFCDELEVDNEAKWVNFLEKASS